MWLKSLNRLAGRSSTMREASLNTFRASRQRPTNMSKVPAMVKATTFSGTRLRRA